MTEGVKNFLQNLGMGKYYGIFSAKGFDLETDIPHLTQTDLKETLMVTCHEEREIILYNAKRFKASTEHFVYEWLRRHSLDHYYISFVQSGLVSLEAVSNIQLPNEELYDELEIVLPGHKKRLEKAVQSLHQDVKRRSVAEKPVTQGWWGKPECLPQAKFDFLCVEGTLFARNEPDKRVKIDFMVDSGSDVSTVQERKLESLNLELVGPVYSCGIHGGNHTNLYRAQLQIGCQQMTVEVIASNYDSLGSRIVRHFRHVIDGDRHIWLKGNYKDPIPAVLPLKLPAATRQLNGESSVLSVEHDKRPTLTMSSKPAALPNQNHHKVSNLEPISSLSSQQSNTFTNSSPSHLLKEKSLKSSTSNNTDLSNAHKEKRSDISGATNGVRTDSCTTYSINNSVGALKLKSDILQAVGSKRTLELSEEDCDKNPERSLKFIKLDKDIGSSPHSSNTSLSHSSSPIKQCLPSSHQHTAHETTPQHISHGLASSHQESTLRDTDDDIDHINSEKIFSKYLSSSSLSLQPPSPSHSQTINIQNLPSSKDSSRTSNTEVNSHLHRNDRKSNEEAISQTDIIHICSDGDESNGFVDDIDYESTVHVHDSQESKINAEGFSKNFIPGNNSSSVTISILDLNEEGFE